MMKKRIVSILCIIALLATMLSVGIITATASGTATMSLGIVDDEGNAVTEMQPGDKAWMAFTLSDYAAAMGDTSIAVIHAFADINTDKFEVVEEAGKAKWATPYTNIVSGGTFTSNVADKVFGAIVETDTNAGATYSISKADLDANNGLLFKVQIAAKADAAAGTEEFKVKATNNTASTSIAFANATAPTLTCDTTAATVEIKAAAASPVTTLVPITDASKWTGKTDKITANGTFAAVTGEGSERVITTVDTFDFGNSLKVSGTLVQRQFSGSTPAKSYVKAGDFKFEIEDDCTTLYVRAVMGEEVVYETSWTRDGLGDDLWTYFQQVDFNATIDNTAKTVALEYTTGRASNPTTNVVSGTYTGDYSFDGVNCVASYKSMWLTNGSSEVAGVLNFSVEKLGGDASSEEVSSEDVSSSTTVETTKTFLPLPSADTTGWVGRGIERIAPEDVVVDGKVYAPQFSLANKVNSSGERPMTTTETFDFGDKLKVSGTLVIHAYHPGFGAKAFVRVGDFKFEISDDTTQGYVKAYMGEEVIYNQSFALALEEKIYVDTLFHQVKFNAVIDNVAKTVELDYTTGPIDALTDNTASAVYTGDHSFDGVTCTASVTNNFCQDTNVTGGTVNVAVPNFSVTYLGTESSEAPSSEEVSSEAPSSEEVSSEAPSSEEVSSEESSSEEVSSEEVSSEAVSSEGPQLPTSAVLLPDTDTSKWTGDTINIKLTDSVVGGNVLAPAGSFVEESNTNSPLQITTVDSYNLGNYFKVSGTLVGNIFRRSDNFYAFASAKAGDFKIVVGDDRDKYDDKILYVRAYMGEELVYEKTWPQVDLGTGVFDQVKFNAVINNTAKTVTLDYTIGKFDSLTNNTGSGTYTGDYSFDSVTATATVQNNWVSPPSYDCVNVAVAGLSVENLGEAPSDDTSSDSSNPGQTTEKVTRLLPLEDIEAELPNWTGRGTERISPEDVVIGGNTYALKGSLVNQVSSNGERPMTTIRTYDFGKKIKVNSTLVIFNFSDSHVATAYIRVGDFKFIIGDDLTYYYFRAYMGEELVYEKLYASEGEHDLFQQVKLNAVIDTETKSVQLDYTSGYITAQKNNTGSGTYTGDYSFDGVTCEAQAQNNFMRNETVPTGTVNVAVVDLSVEKLDDEGSSDSTSSDDGINRGEKLEVSIDQESFKEEDWTGDTAKGEYIHNPGKDNEVVTYYGIVDGEFLCPSNGGAVLIESVKTWDLSGGFNASLDVAFLGKWNFNEVRTLEFSVGPATVTFTNARNTANKNEPPEEFYATLSFNGVELAKGTMLYAPDGIVGIKFDAETNTLYATFFDSPIKVTPTAGGEEVDGIDISSYITDETFANVPLKIYQKGCWAIDRLVSTYSLSTPDSATPEAPPAPSTPSEETSSEPDTSSTPESTAPESSAPSSSAPSSSKPSSSAPSSSKPDDTTSTPNGGGNGGATNNGGTSSKTGETVEYYYYLDDGTYGTATGDSSNVLAAVIVLLAASGAAAGLLISRKRKSNREK